MKRIIVVILLVFSPLADTILCQTTTNYIVRLNSEYEQFKNNAKQYGELSSESIESFKRMFFYFEELRLLRPDDKGVINSLLSTCTRWEELLKEIESDYGHDYLLSLQQLAIRNREFAIDQQEVDAMYDGGEAYRQILIKNQADLFLSSLYFRSELYARLNDSESLVHSYEQWYAVWDIWKDAYSSRNEFDRCIIAYARSLALGMHELPVLAISILVDIINTYEEIENKTPELEEDIELIYTWVNILLGGIGDTSSILFYALRASCSSCYWMYYDINNYLSQLCSYAMAIRDVNADKSVELLEKAEHIIKLERVGKNGRPASRSTKSSVYNELSCSYLRKKMYDKQLSTIKKAIIEDGDVFIPEHYHNLAGAYYHVGDVDNAMDVYQFLEANNALIIDSYSNLALMAKRQGNNEQTTAYAEKYYNGVVSEFQNSTRFMTPRARERYFSDYYHVSYFYNTLSILAKDNPLGTGLAYNAALFQKGLLVRMNNETRRRINASDNNELKQAYADYLHSLAFEDNEEASLSESSLRRLFSKYLDFSDESFNPNWEEVKNALKNDDVAIEFVSYTDIEKERNRYAALVLKRGYNSPLMIDLCDCNELSSLFSNVDATGCPRVYDNIIEPSKMIWGPLTDILSNVNTIYYSPCEALSQINLDIMTYGSSGKCMNQTFKMVRMLSTAELIDPRSFAFETASLMGGFDYGNMASSNTSVQGENFRGFNRSTGWDALESLEEIEGIKQLLSKKTTVSLVMGASADEMTIKSISGNSPSIMHLATHGFYLGLPEARRFAYYSSYEDRWIPEDARCGLILSGANSAWLGKTPAGGNDGTLTAEEINGLDLSNTELVVLSACQTGLGENTSEGTYGLMRAFKNAGVGSIIMSLWEVDDKATTLFMTTFYKQLANGKELHIAFNMAQESVKKKYSSPCYWAAFIMLD